ncbi:MAG TPA: hypothetical protein VMZ74_11600 [Ramlibacter sp.]|nr:hypothetical protein [Ramlibacter sp.]
MSSAIARWLAAASLVLLAACAAMPRSVEISAAQIQSALAKKFPFESRAGDLFVVKVDAPRVALLPDANRIRLEFTFEGADRIVRSAVHGELALSFGLRYEASDASVRLADVRVERIDIVQLPPQWRRQLEPIAAIVGNNLLEGWVLHTFTPEQLARAQGYRPGEIRVTGSGVRVELLPP